MIFQKSMIQVDKAVYRALRLSVYASRIMEEIATKRTTLAALSEKTNMIIREINKEYHAAPPRKYFFNRGRQGVEQYRQRNLLKEFAMGDSLMEFEYAQKENISRQLQCWKFAEGHAYGQQGKGYEQPGQTDLDYIFPRGQIIPVALEKGWIRPDPKDEKDNPKHFFLTPAGEKLPKVQRTLRAFPARDNFYIEEQ